MSRCGWGLMASLWLAGPVWAEATPSAGLSCSDNYCVQWGDIEGEKPNTQYQDSEGFYFKADILTTLSVTVDSQSIDFGMLTPGIMGSRDSVVTVNSTKNMGYNLYVLQQAPLFLDRRFTYLDEDDVRAIIPRTHCDDESDPCSTSVAKVWNNPDQAGFGYTALGDDALASIFGTEATGLKYRQLPLRSAGEDMALVAQATGTDALLVDNQTTLRYQVSPLAINDAGAYMADINYVVIPNF